jgi:hypothetical protein
MHIVGFDFHPSWQQVAILDSETGEIRERKLDNGRESIETDKFQVSNRDTRR